VPYQAQSFFIVQQIQKNFCFVPVFHKTYLSRRAAVNVQTTVTFHTQGYKRKENVMETRIAVIGIIVENPDSVEKINMILHDYSSYIIGRMGIPHQKRKLSIISIVMDAPGDIISALSGKLGMIPQVSSKTVYSKIPSEQ
jgi:putative iron-only hydrogenase system regulator